MTNYDSIAKKYCLSRRIGNSFNRNNSITSVSSSEYNIGYNELNLKFYG
jgi:hypothetical protein